MTPAPALVLPDAPVRPGFADRLRHRRGQLLVGVALGVAVELLLDGRTAGLSYALFALLLGGAIALHPGREAWRQAGEHRWLLAAAVLLFASTMLHTAGWLAAMSVVTSVLLFALTLQGWTGERPLSTLRTGQLLHAPIKTLGQSLYAGAVVTSRDLERSNITTTLGKHGPAALRLGAIVVPPVLLLTVLLSSGDVVFRAKLEALEQVLFGVQLEGFVRGAFVTLISGVVLTGALAMATRRRDQVAITAPRRLLKTFEGLTLLGTLTALLFVFGVTSTPCALAPSACELPAGVTYADAAHEGFFQLLIAAGLILVLLMALPARTQLETPRARLAFTGLSTALVLATMPMLVSAVARLWRYETTYGLTVLRLLAYAGLALVAAVLTWRAITLWAFQSAFVGGALALLTVTLLGLAALGPDAFIARRNLEMEQPDLGYLLTLSDEAMPPLVAKVDALGVEPAVRAVLADEFKSRWLGLAETSSVLSWNVRRAAAERALNQVH